MEYTCTHQEMRVTQTPITSAMLLIRKPASIDKVSICIQETSDTTGLFQSKKVRVIEATKEKNSAVQDATGTHFFGNMADSKAESSGPVSTMITRTVGRLFTFLSNLKFDLEWRFDKNDKP